MRFWFHVAAAGKRLAGALALAALAVAASHAQKPASEDAVKAAYLHKFPGFVEWPADAFRGAGAPIVVAVAGAPAVLDELIEIARGRLVLGRPVQARALAAGEMPLNCHVLFVGRGAAAEARALMDEARRAHMLVVSDLPDGLKVGAVLEFVWVDGRLRFDASLPAARRADIRLSSKLLSVASRVVEEAP